MKIIKISLILLSLLSFDSELFSQLQASNSQENEEEKFSKHAIGLAAGLSTGYGLSYQYTPIQKLTFQLAFAPFKDDFSTTISTGLTFIYRIKEGEKLNLFLYQGNHYLVNRYRNDIGVYDQATGIYTVTSTEQVNNDGINNGLGLGFEFFIGKNMILNLMGGYGARNNFQEIGLTGEFGLFYKL